MLNAAELARKGVSPEMLLDPKSGFKAALYESSFERPPKLVIACAGTEDKKDIIADLRQGVGLGVALDQERKTTLSQLDYQKRVDLSHQVNHSD